MPSATQQAVRLHPPPISIFDGADAVLPIAAHYRGEQAVDAEFQDCKPMLS